jgi:hypothetical protein
MLGRLDSFPLLHRTVGTRDPLKNYMVLTNDEGMARIMGVAGT